MSFTEQCNTIFNQAIRDYHLTDDVDTQINNPYDNNTVEHNLYMKCWIDTVQWHLEDIIRDPHIDPLDALALKRRIDRSNQDRTDLVEQIDSHFRSEYGNVTPMADARLNTESPAWAVDRLSILALKIYHMKEQTERTEASQEHRATCTAKLDVLLEQRKDLSLAIDQLIEDIAAGKPDGPMAQEQAKPKGPEVLHDIAALIDTAYSVPVYLKEFQATTPKHKVL